MASPTAKSGKLETYTERADALRARGNVLYGELAAGGGGNAEGKRSKLKRAQELYDEGLQLSCNSEKRASFCKNLGALHYLWGKVELELMPSWNEQAGGSGEGRCGGGGGGPSSKLLICTQHLGKAMNFFVRAHVEGARAQKPREWMQQVGSSLTGLVTWAAEQSAILAFPGVPILTQVCEDLEKMGRNNLAFKVEAEALANLELANCLFLIREADASDNVPEEACEEALNRATHLLQSLQPSPITESLHQRICSLRSNLLPARLANMFRPPRSARPA